MNIQQQRQEKTLWLWAGFIAVITFAVYLLTLAPTVTAEDSGELVTAAYRFGVCHPPGYPLWTMLAGLFTFLPFSDPAYAANLMSAAFAASAVVVLFFLLLETGIHRPVSFAASLAYGFSLAFWSQAVITEVYTLAVFLFLTLTLLLMKWRKTGKTGYFYASCFIYGLSLSSHWPLMGIITPGILILLFFHNSPLPPGENKRPNFPLPIGERMKVRGKTLLFGLLFVLLGLLPYLYLPLAARHAPTVSWGDCSTLGGFWKHISRAQYQKLDFGVPVPPATKFLFLGHFFLQSLKQFTPYLFFLVILGFFSLWQNKRFLFYYVLGVIFSNSVLLTLVRRFTFESEHIMVTRVYYLPAYAMLAICLGAGLQEVFVYFKNQKYRLKTFCLGLVLALVVILPLARNWKENNMSRYFYAFDFNSALLKQAPEKAILFTGGDYNAFPCLYLQEVKGVRPDILLADPFGYHGLKFNEYYRELFSGEPSSLDKKTTEEKIIQRSSRPILYASKNDVPGQRNYEIVPSGLTYRILAKSEKNIRPLSPDMFLNLRNRTDKHPADEMASSIIGDYYMMEGEYYGYIGENQLSRENFSRAMETAWDNKEALNNLGSTCAEKGYASLAEESWERAIMIYPGYLLAYENLIKLYNTTGEFRKKEAVEEFLAELTGKEISSEIKAGEEDLGNMLSALEQEPRNYALCNNIGNKYAELGQVEEALKYYQRAFSINPAYALPHKNMALLYENLLKDKAKAEYHQQKYLELENPRI